MIKFTKRKDAINFYKKSKDKRIIFAEDQELYDKHKLTFYVLTLDEAYKYLMDKKESDRNLYEQYFENQPIYFVLDLDIIYPPHRKNLKKFLTNIIDKCRKQFEKINEIPKVIILKCPSKPEKDSAHIIFRTSKPFKNIRICYLFYQMIFDEKEHDVDKYIYRPDCMRLRTCYSTKRGENRFLLPYTEIEGCLTPKDYASDLEFWQDTLITNIDRNAKDFIKIN